MQYWQGTWAATARPISSLVLPLSPVFGLSCTDLNSAHAPAMPASGNILKKVGTEPSVCSMSRYVAWADTSCAGADVTIPAIAVARTRAVSIVPCADSRMWMLQSEPAHPHGTPGE